MLRSTLLLIAATSVSAVQLGCFSDNSETLSNFVNNGTFLFQSTGYCQRACVGIGYNYYALKDGDDCWCGDAVPPISDMVDDSNCNLPCPGYVRQNCGGANAFAFYLSGPDTAIASIVSAYSFATSASATVPASDSVTVAIITTAASSESSSSSSSVAGSSAPTTTSASTSAATTTKASSSAVVVPSATSTSTSVPTHTGAAVAVNVQIGFGLMAGLIALTSAL